MLNKKLVFAKYLRKNLTNAEQILWYNTRSSQLGFKIKRQVPIGPYIVDFGYLKEKLLIEIDGDSHTFKNQFRKDQIRNIYLLRKGYKIIRFTNEQIYNNLENVLEKISLSLPSPTCGGRG